MPAAAAAPYIIGGGGALTGFFGNRSQRDAQRRAGAQQVEAGYDASQYVWDTVNGVNPAIAESARNGGLQVLDASNGAATGVLNAQQQAARGVNTATGEANAGMNNAVTGANGYLNPYITQGQTGLGTLGELLSPNGRYTQLMDEKFTFDPAQDPSYQFVVDQATKAFQKSAAARGGLLSGGAMQSLAKLGAGLGSMEYAKQHERFQQDRNNRANILNNMSGQLQGLAGMGLTAGTTSGNNLIRGAQYTGDNSMDAAVYSGNTGMQAEQWAGDRRIDGARYNSDINFRGVQDTSRNAINASIYQGNNRMAIGDAEASSTIGASQFNPWTGAFNGAVKGYMLGSQLRPRGTSGGTRGGPSWSDIGYDPDGSQG